MKMLNSLRNRVGAAAFAVGALVPVEMVKGETPVRVTQADVEWSNQKVADAYGAIVDMWTKDFKLIGKRFDAPRLVRYTGSVRTACGMMQPQNAQYCLAANAIYYDETFVAGMAKITADQLHTDGDMASIGIIAHETGHAVAFQLGHHPRDSYKNESTADCLSGAFTNQANRDKSLEDGDMEEALLGVEMAGDPPLRHRPATADGTRWSRSRSRDRVTVRKNSEFRTSRTASAAVQRRASMSSSRFDRPNY